MQALSKAPQIDQPVLDAWIGSLQDDDRRVQEAAVTALIASGQAASQVVPQLTELLKAPESRSAAAIALGRLGPAAAPAADALVDALLEVDSGRSAGDELDLDRQQEIQTLVAAIGRVGSAAAGPLLRQLTEQADPPPSISEALGAIGRQAAPPLIEALQDPRPSLRAGAARALGGMSGLDEEQRRPLLALLQDSDADVRSAAIMALASGEGLADLREQLQQSAVDKDPRVRRAAMQALARDTAPARWETIRQGLQDDDAQVRKIAVTTAGQQAEWVREAAETLIALMSDTDASVRAAAAVALSSDEETARKASGRFAELLEDSDPTVLSAALRALGAAGKQEHAPLELVAQLVRHPEAEVRSAAVEAAALMYTAPAPLVELLTRSLNDQEWSVRKTATAALGRQGASAVNAVPALWELLESDQDREGARAALREIDTAPPAAAPLLKKALYDDDRRLRFFAVYLLGKIGPPAKDVLPDLKKLLDGDQSDRFRDFVKKTIDSIEGKSSE